MVREMRTLCRPASPLPLMCATLLLFGCGGDGGNEGPSAEMSAPQSLVLEGRLMNGIIAGATVRAYDAVGQLAGTAVSDSEGRFELALAIPGPYRFVSSGGWLNGTEYLGELAAWCDKGPACWVTPLSTALVNLMQEGGFNAGDGKAFLSGALQLTEDPFLGDGGGVGFDLAAARVALANGAGL